MADSYSLPPRRARICSLAGAVFLLIGAFTLVDSIVVSIAPGPAIRYTQTDGWSWEAAPEGLLDDDQQRAITSTPGATDRFRAYAWQPLVRLGIFGVTLIGALPFAAMMIGVGLALRRLGAHAGDPLADSLPWLRRASLAAILSSIAVPLHDSLLESLLSRGTPEGPQWSITVDVLPIGNTLLLAVAAYATVWALEGAVRAQRDLAKFV